MIKSKNLDSLFDKTTVVRIETNKCDCLEKLQKFYDNRKTDLTKNYNARSDQILLEIHYLIDSYKKWIKIANKKN